MNSNTKQPENPNCKHWKDTPHGAITCVNPFDGKCIECGKQVKEMPFKDCPKCFMPFEPFLRYQVSRPERKWILFGKKRKTFALICRACKDIVGYE